MPALKPSQGVDTHAHVFSATAPAVDGARYRPAYAARLEAWQALWGLAGITRGVLVQPSFFGDDNSELLAALAADRDRLRGVAVVDRAASDAQLDRLAAGGVCAVRMNLKGAADHAAFVAGGWRSFFDRVHRRGWHVEVFVDHGRLPDVVPAFEGSEVAVVLDHFGNPGIERHSIDATFRAVAALAAERPVWCKLSAPYRLGGTDGKMLAERWIDVAGPSRLLWGSDWPWTSHEAGADYRRAHQDLARWVGPGLSGAILWDNAARLYRFT
ncbi:MAG: amidohydrolase family protein [Usitatibacter sp.]